MSAKYPTQLYTERETENLPGIVFDTDKKQNLFSEDFQNHASEIIAIETALGVNLGNIPTPLTKATGAEIDTGTNDTKFVTPKAIEDSNLARTTDIPSVPSKATGAEITTGTNDTKFVTPKAMADAGVNVPGAGGAVLPHLTLSTIFETIGRFNTYVSGAGATSALDKNGSILHTDVNTSSYGGMAGISMQFPVGSRSTVEIGSPVFSSHFMVGAGSDMQGFVGMGAMTGAMQSALPYINKHIGFRISRVASGNIEIYASQGDGSAVTESLLTTISNYDYLDVILKVNGTSSIDYYFRKNGGALSSATNLTTHIPSGVDGALTILITNYKVASSSELYTSLMSYER